MSDQLAIDRVHQLLAEHDPSDTSPRDFLGAQFDAGLAWVHFPEGRGDSASSRRPSDRSTRPSGRRAPPRRTGRTPSATGWEPPRS